jgi:ketosteroid isomerase-like protein
MSRTPKTDEQVEAEVLATFDAMREALCERRDADAAWRLFADQDDVVMWGSGPEELAVGYAAIGRLFRELVAASSDPLTFRWDFQQVRVAGDLAWVNAAGEWVRESNGQRETGPYRITAVLVWRDGAWL